MSVALKVIEEEAAPGGHLRIHRAMEAALLTLEQARDRAQNLPGQAGREAVEQVRKAAALLQEAAGAIESGAAHGAVWWRIGQAVTLAEGTGRTC